MRVTPVRFSFDSLEQVLKDAEASASVTHNHPEGLKGAQAVATSIFLVRSGETKSAIKSYIKTTFGYLLNKSLDNIRKTYKFDASCQGSVPQAITAFLESNDYEDAVRKAISIGGDSDTIACITGGIAQVFCGEVPCSIKEQALQILDQPLQQMAQNFSSRFQCL